MQSFLPHDLEAAVAALDPKFRTVLMLRRNGLRRNRVGYPTFLIEHVMFGVATAAALLPIARRFTT